VDKKLSEAIIKTLAYSDIFDFPLNPQELYEYLEGYPLDSPKLISPELINNVPQIDFLDGLFFLKGREEIVSLRREKQKWTKQKKAIAQKVAQKLGLIPWIKMIAVTGGVAAGNAEEDHDIDLLFITASGRLWLSRLLEKISTELMGIRRHPGNHAGEKAKNKVCPNMYLDSQNLKLPHHDLFTAREIAQMKPILNRDQTYEKFLTSNSWMKEWLPNWWGNKLKMKSEKLKIKRRKTQSPATGRQSSVLNFFEHLAKKLQLNYMSSKRTTETITETLLMFHPDDQRRKTIKKYRQKLHSLGLTPTQCNLN